MPIKTMVAILLLLSASYGQVVGPGSTNSSPAVVTTDQVHTPNFLVTSISFSHEMLALPNPLLRVDCVKNTWPGTRVTSVIVNGHIATLIAQLKGLASNKPTDTSSWVMTGLPPGTANIFVSSTGGATNGYGVSCVARDYYGVDQANPVAWTDLDNVPPNLASMTCSFLPDASGELISIFEYSTAYAQASATSAIPAAELIAGRFFAEQFGVADIPNVTAGRSYSQEWDTHNSKISVEWSIISLGLRPAQQIAVRDKGQSRETLPSAGEKQ